MRCAKKEILKIFFLIVILSAFYFNRIGYFCLEAIIAFTITFIIHKIIYFHIIK